MPVSCLSDELLSVHNRTKKGADGAPVDTVDRNVGNGPTKEDVVDSNRERTRAQVAVPHGPDRLQDATAVGRADVGLANVGAVMRVDGDGPLDGVISNTLAELGWMPAPWLLPAPRPKKGICH